MARQTGFHNEIVGAEEDERYMRLALKLAELGRGQTHPNPMVGAVIVRGGEVVGQGAHLKPGGPHAEVHALRMAGATPHEATDAASHDVTGGASRENKAAGSTVYVTLEPCSHHGRTPPCADALVEAGVARVVVACLDPNPDVAGAGIRRLQDAGIEVVSGVCAEEAQALNEAYFTWRKHSRPHVIWKSAATLDGYIATNTGDSRWVTGSAAREQVHRLRGEVDAIAVGVGTVLADDPLLTARTPSGVARNRQPLRVVFDSTLRTPSSAGMLRQPGRTLIFVTDRVSPEQVEAFLRSVAEASGADPSHAEASATGTAVDVVRLPADASGRVPVTAALAELASRGALSVLLEGGATLAAEMIRNHLVDDVVYYIAPKLLGGGLPALTNLNLTRMSEAVRLVEVQWSRVGDDLCVKGRVEYGT